MSPCSIHNIVRMSDAGRMWNSETTATSHVRVPNPVPPTPPPSSFLPTTTTPPPPHSTSLHSTLHSTPRSSVSEQCLQSNWIGTARAHWSLLEVNVWILTRLQQTRTCVVSLWSLASLSDLTMKVQTHILSRSSRAALVPYFWCSPAWTVSAIKKT